MISHDFPCVPAHMKSLWTNNYGMFQAASISPSLYLTLETSVFSVIGKPWLSCPADDGLELGLVFWVLDTLW